MNLAFETRLARRRTTTNWLESGLIVASLVIGLTFVISTGSVLRGMLLKPPPLYVEPQSIVTVGQVDALAGESTTQPVSWGLFENWKELDRWQGRIAASQIPRQASVRISGSLRPLTVQYATSNLFRVLGVSPSMGRIYTEADTGGPPLALVSATIWDQEFGGHRSPRGEEIFVNGNPARIIGVLPERFWFLTPGTQIWLPLYPPLDFERRRVEDINVVARLPEGVSARQAEQEFQTVVPSFRQRAGMESRDITIVCNGILARNVAHGRGEGGFVLLFLFAFLILALACTNATLLFLGRWDRRSSEIGLRIALGATRAETLRLALIESTTLVGIGGIVGIILGAYSVAIILSRGPIALRSFDIGLDTQVLAATVCILVLVAVFVAAWPAIMQGGIQPAGTLNERTFRSTRSRVGSRLGSALVSVQIAIAVVAVFLAASLFGGYRSLLARDVGVDSDAVVSFALIAEVGVSQAIDSDRIAHDVAQLGGVRSVAYSQYPVLHDAGHFELLTRPLFAATPGQNRISVQRVSPSYFATIGARFELGQDFSTLDARQGGRDTAIVNRSAADVLWPNEDPIGKEIGLEVGTSVVVVGVVRDIVNAGLFTPTLPCVFLPLRPGAEEDVLQQPNRSFVARVSDGVAAGSLLPEIRSVIAKATPRVGIQRIETVSAGIERLARELLLGVYLLTPLLIVSIFLIVVGLVGLLKSIYYRSRREFGIRVSVGATTSDLSFVMLRRWATLVGLGLIPGLVVSWVITQFLRSTVVVFSGADWHVYAVAGIVVTFGTLPALVFPLQMVARIEPWQVIRG